MACPLASRQGTDIRFDLSLKRRTRETRGVSMIALFYICSARRGFLHAPCCLTSGKLMMVFRCKRAHKLLRRKYYEKLMELRVGWTLCRIIWRNLRFGDECEHHWDDQLRHRSENEVNSEARCEVDLPANTSSEALVSLLLRGDFAEATRRPRIWTETVDARFNC